MASIPNTLTATTTTDVSLSPLARLAGPLALAAGALFTATQLVLFAIVTVIDRTDPHWTEGYYANPVTLANNIALFVAFCLLALALLAAYAREAHRAGALGAIAVGVALVGTMGMAGDAWYEAFAAPWIADIAPEVFTNLMINGPSGMLPIGSLSSFVLFALGWVLFGIASLRARIFPSAISIAIVVGGLAGFQALAMPPIGAILGLAMVWLGVWLLRTTRAVNMIVEPATN
jgi:hypothetical protein